MSAGEQDEALRNVFWIGGATAAGKSTAADVLAERYGVTVYHFDRQEPFHVYRSIPEEQPHLIRFMGRTMDDRWVLRSPEAMVEELLASWTERFSMVVDDLRSLVQEGPVVAEGAGLFPILVYPLLTVPPNGVWLIPSAEFQRWVRETRGASVAKNSHISDQDRARENVIARDGLLARRLQRQAEDLSLPMISVDARSVTSVPDCIDARLESWLQSLPHPSPSLVNRERHQSVALRPQTPPWYDRLAEVQERYFYPWQSHLPPRHGEDVYAEVVRESVSHESDVLDVACAQGDIALTLAPSARSVVGYDRTAKWIELARHRAAEQGITNAQFVVHDSSPGANGGSARLPGAGGSYDLLICSKGPFHWVEDARRVARPGARVMMLVPNPTPLTPWTTMLPEQLAWTDPENGNPLWAHDNISSRLNRIGIFIESYWTFVVPETFERPEDLYEWRAFGYTSDEVPAFDEVCDRLEQIFDRYGSVDGVSVLHSRFLWTARVPT
jgi:SAM-dependent methyltransferase